MAESFSPGHQKGFPSATVPMLTWKIGTLAVSRLVLNTARRFAYPFAPALSRGLGVPLTSVTAIIAVYQASPLLGLLFGPLADRLGYRLMMLAGLGLLATGLFLGGVLPLYGVVMAGLFLAGLGKSVYDPAYQAYIGDRVPFQQRGRVIGIIETSWAGSTLLGIPLIGILIDRLGWRAPFFGLGAMGLAGIVAIRLLIPEDKRRAETLATPLGIRQVWRKLLQEKTALGTLGFAFFVSAANDTLFVIYGAWLESAFNLSIVAIGFGTVTIGLAELGGELFTVFWADRFGLKKSVYLGLGLSTLAYGLLPVWGGTLPFALGGLFLIFLTLEFTIVSFLSLCTELHPDSRATMIAGFFAAGGIGRIAGALIGVPIWQAGGIFGTGMVSAAISALALVSVTWGLKDWAPRQNQNQLI